MPHDAYLAHASENGPAAKDLAEALRDRGLTVWFNRFIVGPSIREQMENGLRDSDFGIVLLSPEFFAKKWPRAELDALMGLEAPGEVRILPVWWNITEADVRVHSPMLAMRSAAVLGEAGVKGIADALLESIIALSSYKSPAKRLRLQIATGFRWLDGPLWMPASHAQYDRAFGEDYLATDLVHAGYDSLAATWRGRDAGQVVPLIELFRAHSFWDGKRVTVIGHQVRSSVQVLEELIRDEDLPPDSTRPPGECVAAYVFRLSSVDFEHGEQCYVHCIGPYSTGRPGMGPNAPDDDSLCWVTGLLMAFGHMPNSRGEIVRATYLAASSILFTPPAPSDPPT